MINQQNIPQLQSQVGREKVLNPHSNPPVLLCSIKHKSGLIPTQFVNINYQSQSLEADFPPFIFISEILLQLSTTRMSSNLSGGKIMDCVKSQWQITAIMWALW